MRLSRPDAPQDMERAADRNRAARRSSRPLLDPHGIYGTRTAARQRAARRRQAVQSLSVLLLIVAVVFATLWKMRGGNVRQLANLQRSDLGGRVAAAPVLGRIRNQSVLVVPREDGSLLLRWPQSQTAWSGEFALRAAPIVAGERIFAAAENGAVVALDAAPGTSPRLRWKWFAASTVATKPVWLMPAREILPVAPTPNTVVPTPSVAAPLLIVADDEGNVAALRASDGRQLWVQRLGAPAGNAVVAASLASAATGTGPLAGRVWVPLGAGASGFNGGLACVETRSGRVLWKVPTDGPVLAAPVVQEAQARVFCADDAGSLWSFDARTGRKIWKVSASPSKPDVLLRGDLALIEGGSRLISGGNDGILRCLNTISGAELWRFETGAPVRMAAVPFQSYNRALLACANDNATVFVLDAISGRLQGSAQIASRPQSITAGATIETVSSDGWLEKIAPL